MEQAAHGRKRSRLVILGIFMMVLPLAGGYAVQPAVVAIRILIAILFLLGTSTSLSTSAKAQANLNCSEQMAAITKSMDLVNDQMRKSLPTTGYKRITASTREYLTNCRDQLTKEEYAEILSVLASGLNGDNQRQEALAVSNRCMQIDPTNLSCSSEKADSLFALGRLQETKSIVEKSLTLAAITEIDAKSKEMLRLLLTRVNAALKHQPPASPKASSPSLERDKYGTGFFVSGDGHIITNRHVVEGCSSIETADHIALKLIKSNKAIDVALLQAPGLKSPSAARFRQSNAAIGEPVIIFGFPLPGLLSKSGNLTTGVVSATTGLGNNQHNIQISAPVQSGNSGGPLFDQSGNVIGVVVSKLNAVKLAGITGDLAQNVNFAIKSSEVISFLGRNNVVPKFSGQTENIKTEEVATFATSFTVQLICHPKLERFSR